MASSRLYELLERKAQLSTEIIELQHRVQDLAVESAEVNAAIEKEMK